MRTVHIVVPNDIDDLRRPSGGNHYDRRIARGLEAAGWSVHEHAGWGAWPQPSDADRARLAALLAALPDGAAVVIDGLVASPSPDVLAFEAERLRLVVLVHMPVGDHHPELREPERRALAAAAAVVTTSEWSSRRLLDRYDLPPGRVHVAPPGVDAAPLALGSDEGTRLLCVAAVTVHKGHDQLVEALTNVADRPWSGTFVGPVDREPEFVETLRRRCAERGIADRIDFAGPCTGPDLGDRYAAADLLVLASRREAYGMVVTEALARGIPVLATATGGLPEALGYAPDGGRPGLLVPPDDPAALAAALRQWLADPDARDTLRRRAWERRLTLTGWDHTATLVAQALSAVEADVAVRR
jgi:glycosyltransferase involved in cell wall biosynthesis